MFPEKFVDQVGDFRGLEKLVDKSELCSLMIDVQFDDHVIMRPGDLL